MQNLISELRRLFLLPVQPWQGEDRTPGGELTDAVLEASLTGQKGVVIDLVGEGTVRALVVDFGRGDDWPYVEKLHRALHGELELPAAGMSVSGRNGYGIWLSLEQAVPVARARHFLSLVRRLLLPDRIQEHVALLPEGAGLLQLPPCLNRASGQWAAFIQPSTVGFYNANPGFVSAPNPVQQTKFLARLKSIPPLAFERAIAILEGRLPQPAAAPEEPAVPPRRSTLKKSRAAAKRKEVASVVAEVLPAPEVQARPGQSAPEPGTDHSVLAARRAELSAILARTSTQERIGLPFASLEELLGGGLKSGRLYLMLDDGNGAAGLLAAQLAEHAAEAGHATLHASFARGRAQLLEQSLARRSGIPLSAIEMRGVDAAQQQLLSDTLDRLLAATGLRLEVMEAGADTLYFELAEWARAHAEGGTPALMVVEPLALLHCGISSIDDQGIGRRIREVAGKLKALAREFGTVIVAVAEARESAIWDAADELLDIGILPTGELGVGAVRRGGSVRLAFRPECCAVEETKPQIAAKEVQASRRGRRTEA